MSVLFMSVCLSISLSHAHTHTPPAILEHSPKVSEVHFYITLVLSTKLVPCQLFEYEHGHTFLTELELLFILIHNYSKMLIHKYSKMFVCERVVTHVCPLTTILY